jgi:hypothetical protein
MQGAGIQTRAHLLSTLSISRKLSELNRASGFEDRISSKKT